MALVLGFLSGCGDKESMDVSRKTDFPLIELAGPSTVFHPLGTNYDDPGATATEGGQTIDVTSSASGTYRGGSSIDVNVADCYNVTYTATNKDGFPGSASRTVYVYNTGDLVNSIEGLYTATVVRNGVASPQYENLEYVLIWKNADGTYQISDGIGLYYAEGRGYGINYISSGAVVTANSIPANDFSITDFSNDGFGGVHTMTNMVVDASAGTVSFTTDWSYGFTFDVTLTQVK